MQGADVIFRSSDHVSFRVHKLILAISSPFFTDLFSLPQPPDDEVIEGLPVVQVSEDAELLHGLFTVFYPIPLAIPDSYEKTLALLAASQKYNMTTVLSAVRSEIGRQLPTTEEPYRCSRAQRCETWYDSASVAATIWSCSSRALFMVATPYQECGLAAARLNARYLLPNTTKRSSLGGYVTEFCLIPNV
ncbi:hypothetical protein EDB87DRAFT_941903 [Lactarius vividus]|nr:hypothetical protein EDB87DRAFT_941903 [Lactarius vividus]